MTGEIDLLDIGCEQGLDFSEANSEIHAMYLFFNPGEFDIGFVRAE